MQLKHILIFLFSIVFIVLAFVFREKLSEFKSLGLLGIFFINLIGNATVLIPAPAIASVIAGGALYPPFAVAIVSALGGAIGDMVGFFLGLSSKELFIKNHHTWYKILKDIFHRSGDLVILVFAFIPNPFFDVIGIMAGVFRYSPIRFFIFLFLGRFIRGIFLSYLGFAFGAM